MDTLKRIDRDWAEIKSLYNGGACPEHLRSAYLEAKKMILQRRKLHAMQNKN